MDNNQKEVTMWNEIYSSYEPMDLRNLSIKVEPGFDQCLKEFGTKTNYVLDFGCGTGDILFQYAQLFPEKRGMGIDTSKTGISFAEESAKLSGYHHYQFWEGDATFLDEMPEGTFDGIIISNVLDVLPEPEDKEILKKLDRVLKKGGYWLIKLNPYYTAKELREFEYEKTGHHLYGKDGILRLHQETTQHWKKFLRSYGSLERYMEFVYPWQEGLNRLFLIRKGW